MYDKIVDIENIAAGYFELLEKFDTDSKTHKYCGIDGLTLNDINIDSLDLINEIQSELINLKPIDPVLETEIPKKDGSKRKIYIYTVKERIKAQAIYRVIEPLFENNFSDFLFSYRSSHPHYQAATSVVKRYTKYYGQDTVLVSDVSDYFLNIDKDTMINKLFDLGLDSQTIELCKLFINNSIYKDGEILVLKKGLISGVPLIVIFANLYLNEVDKYIGKKVSLYRRVGDDFIIFDKNREKVLEIKEFLLAEIKKLKLSIKESKTKVIKSSESFDFLGYTFHDKKISIQKRSIKKMLNRWSSLLKYYPISLEKKLSFLQKTLYDGAESINNDFIQVIALYRIMNNSLQIKELSENFFRILTKYFFKNYSSKNQHSTLKITKNIKIPSLYKYYLDFHNGRKNLASLSLKK